VRRGQITWNNYANVLKYINIDGDISNEAYFAGLGLKDEVPDEGPGNLGEFIKNDPC